MNLRDVLGRLRIGFSRTTVAQEMREEADGI